MRLHSCCASTGLAGEQLAQHLLARLGHKKGFITQCAARLQVQTPMLQAYLRRPRMGAWNAWCSSSWYGLPEGAPPLSHFLLPYTLHRPAYRFAAGVLACTTRQHQGLGEPWLSQQNRALERELTGIWMQGLGRLGPECLDGAPLLAVARAAAGGRRQPACADGLPPIVPRADRGIPGKHKIKTQARSARCRPVSLAARERNRAVLCGGHFSACPLVRVGLMAKAAPLPHRGSRCQAMPACSGCDAASKISTRGNDLEGLACRGH